MQIGDVLLVTGTNKISPALVIAQKALYSRAISSHVALSLGDGVFIHATGDKGVHLTLITDELDSCKPGWKVVRLKHLTAAQRDEVMKAALFFLRQGYNAIFMGAGNDSSSFCSELVAHSFAKANIHLFGERLPSKVAPAHFDEQVDVGEHWIDVTDEYKVLCGTIRKEPDMFRLGMAYLQATLARRAFASKKRIEIFTALESLSDSTGNENLRKMVGEVKQGLRENRTLKFWDEKDAE